jgi:glycosyltransferase involved in cell wall biosynthesis
MQIDFVITELFVGGAERCLTELALGMSDAGDRVRVFSIGSLPTHERGALVSRLQDAGIEVSSGEANTHLQVISAYGQLRQWLAKSNAEICQTFLHHANVLGTFAAKSAGVPMRVAGIRVAESKTLRCKIERLALKSSQSVICVSKAVEDFAARHLGCPPSKLTVIPNGVDIQNFANAKQFNWSQIGWPEDAAVTLFVGRLHQQKGIELLQSEIDRLAPSGSNRRLLLVGDGPLRANLEAWATRHGPHQVQLLGWRPDIASLMASSRLVILPSHYEGMPNVILEAMAAGKPVVCSRVEGSQELLRHDWEHQTFPTGDSQQMATLASRFLGEAPVAKATGTVNQTFIHDHYTMASMVQRYRNHYQKLLGDQ